MINEKSKFDIYDRAFTVAVRIAKLINKLPKNSAVIEYTKQLIRSSGSVGANIEEADGALTTKDFINKIGIARREARESRHWLRLIGAVILIDNEQDKHELQWLINESKEIMLILSAIIKNTGANLSK